MKGLLQSKYFKNNLKKWVFMYVLCMGIFTTVITYSQYISNMFSTDDSARVSNFGLNLMYCDDEICQKSRPDKPIKYRPFGEMEYYFAIDSSALEVSVDLILTVRVDRHLKIERVEKMPGANDKPIQVISKDDASSKTISFTDSLMASDKQITKYKVVVTYDEKVIDYNKEGCKEASSTCKIVNGVIEENGVYKYIFDEKSFDSLSVDYSAVQTK